MSALRNAGEARPPAQRASGRSLRIKITQTWHAPTYWMHHRTGVRPSVCCLTPRSAAWHRCQLLRHTYFVLPGGKLVRASYHPIFLVRSNVPPPPVHPDLALRSALCLSLCRPNHGGARCSAKAPSRGLVGRVIERRNRVTRAAGSYPGASNGFTTLGQSSWVLGTPRLAACLFGGVRRVGKS